MTNRRVSKRRRQKKEHTIHRVNRTLYIQCNGVTVAEKTLPRNETFIQDGLVWMKETMAKHKEECDGLQERHTRRGSGNGSDPNRDHGGVQGGDH